MRRGWIERVPDPRALEAGETRPERVGFSDLEELPTLIVRMIADAEVPPGVTPDRRLIGSPDAGVTVSPSRAEIRRADPSPSFQVVVRSATVMSGRRLVSNRAFQWSEPAGVIAERAIAIQVVIFR